MGDWVFIEQAPNKGMEHPVESGTTIGREGCDITLGDPDVSRRHATVQVEGGSLTIEDLGSTNGTYVNGERIGEPRVLKGGDEVRIGAIVWQLRAPAGVTRLAKVQGPEATPQQATTIRRTGDVAPATEQPAAPPPAAPRPAAPAAAQPAAAATPTPAPPAPATAGRRGDVPPPDFQPSAIRRVVPGADAPTAFVPPGQRRGRGSAATRVGATILATVIVALTAAGVVVYYITEPFA